MARERWECCPNRYGDKHQCKEISKDKPLSSSFLIILTISKEYHYPFQEQDLLFIMEGSDIKVF